MILGRHLRYYLIYIIDRNINIIIVKFGKNIWIPSYGKNYIYRNYITALKNVKLFFFYKRFIMEISLHSNHYSFRIKRSLIIDKYLYIESLKHYISAFVSTIKTMIHLPSFNHHSSCWLITVDMYLVYFLIYLKENRLLLQLTNLQYYYKH